VRERGEREGERKRRRERGERGENLLGLCLGFVTESNKPFIRFGVTGPILKSTTEVTWAGRERKHRAKNDVEPRVH